MKKSILVVFIFAVFLFIGCQDPASDTQDAVDLPIGKVGYVSKGFTDIFNSGFTPSIAAEALKRNVELLTVVADSQDLQVAAIRNLIEQGVSVVVVYPATEKTAPEWEAVLAEAKSAGVGVVFIVFAPDEALDYTTLLVSNDYDNGKLDADWIKAHVSGAQTILELSGPEGHPAAIARHNGFWAEKPADWTLAGTVYGDWSPESGTTEIGTWLTINSNPHIDVLFSHNDGMALAAIDTLVAHGYTVGTDVGEIRVVSIDAVDTALASIAAGVMACTVDQGMPAVGPVLFDVIQEYVNGTALAKKIYSNNVCIDKNNLP